MDLARVKASLLRIPADYVDVYRHWQRGRLKAAAPLAHGRLLDVGCGHMPHRELFLPHVTEYVGLERSDTFELTDASQRAGGPDVYYDGTTIPFPDASVDSVLNVDVLEHVPEPTRVVAEMSRVLKDGGTLILSAPFSFRLHEEPHDYFRYTPHGLKALCEASDLEIVRVDPYGSLPSVLAHKINSYLLLGAARMGELGQSIGKFGHEGTLRVHPRYWTLPLIAPLVLATATAARVLDARPPVDPTEALGFLFVAKRRKRASVTRI